LDRIESEALYNILENEIIPTYFELDRAEIPRRWIAMMKSSMSTLGQFFNTHRMVMDYCDRYYTPAYRSHVSLNADKGEKARRLAAWRGLVSQHWQSVKINSEDITPDRGVKAGEELPVRIKLSMKELKPEDVAVEVLFGSLNPDGEIVDGQIVRLSYQKESNNMAVFEGAVPCRSGGRKGYAVRVRPDHPDMVNPFTPLLLTWE